MSRRNEYKRHARSDMVIILLLGAYVLSQPTLLRSHDTSPEISATQQERQDQ
jgi:hypothetical protein